MVSTLSKVTQLLCAVLGRKEIADSICHAFNCYRVPCPRGHETQKCERLGHFCKRQEFCGNNRRRCPRRDMGQGRILYEVLEHGSGFLVQVQLIHLVNEERESQKSSVTCLKFDSGKEE